MKKKTIKCPKCNVEVLDGNFCEHCGAKLKEECDCWVLKKKYNCGLAECKVINSSLNGSRGKVFLNTFRYN